MPAESTRPGRRCFLKTAGLTAAASAVPFHARAGGAGGDKLHMTFIGFDGKGYQSFVAESDDLVHWTNMRLAMGYGPEGGFDHGGVVLGAFLYEDYDIKAPRTLKKKDGKYWSLYGAYPRQGGYELRPGYEGVASSEDGLTWRRAKDEPILSVHQEDCGAWEKDCIYQPWLVEHEGRYYNFYNAANGHIEQMGLALSDDLLEWKRHAHNPVIPNGPKGSYNEKFSSDGKVFRDGDHWVCFFFGVGRGGAHIMAAFSRDLQPLDRRSRTALQGRRQPVRAGQAIRPQDLAGLEPGQRDLLHVLQRRRQQGPRHRPDHQQAARRAEAKTTDGNACSTDRLNAH